MAVDVERELSKIIKRYNTLPKDTRDRLKPHFQKFKENYEAIKTSRKVCDFYLKTASLQLEMTKKPAAIRSYILN